MIIIIGTNSDKSKIKITMTHRYSTGKVIDLKFWRKKKFGDGNMRLLLNMHLHKKEMLQLFNF
jgi:hypothetical protein